MTTLSAQQIAQAAYAAGFRGDALVTAVAVALAESSGRLEVVNSLGCVGLWQIRESAHPQYTTAELQTAAGNASAAYAISSSGTNWTPWQTYTTGVYSAQLGRARLAVAALNTGAIITTNLPLPDGTGVAQGLGGTSLPGLASAGASLTSIATLAIHATEWIANPHNWLRVIEVIGGGVAVILGLKMLADTGVGGPVAGAVRAGVHTAGRATSAVKSTAKIAAEGAMLA